jgi:hypothetical protein
MSETINFLVEVKLDEEGDGTVPSEADLTLALVPLLETYPIEEFSVEVAT